MVQFVAVDAGATVAFPCAVHNVSDRAPLPHFAWMHNKRVLAHLRNGRLINTGPFDLQHSVQSRPAPASPFADATVTLTWKNVTWPASGDVTCVQHCLGSPGMLPVLLETAEAPLCASHYFRLLVFSSASELFAVPMSDVSVNRGADAHISCVAHRLEGNMPAFIWRLNGHVTAAPADHPLQALARAVVDRRSRFLPAEHFPLSGISTAEDSTIAFSTPRRRRQSTAR
ncbi:uncharacterized protein LOC129598996 [Paramacrobiotus metropolitanus]|uniref:uncharacterized protein LOC129598996 n=1 Tax=Paramacrobiotus metropolitanus TaxID=2943436 RepID=UPI002445FBDF|nr:uncharacterized protein LOC129598996 [Paramacrobiotus metropolitanus]XP_055353082.1 uncharacterized protein LOC129598996 [Paramacrobiotus metropolitanus]